MLSRDYICVVVAWVDSPFGLDDIEQRKSMAKALEQGGIGASRRRHTWFAYIDSNHEAGPQPDFKSQISN